MQMLDEMIRKLEQRQTRTKLVLDHLHNLKAATVSMPPSKAEEMARGAAAILEYMESEHLSLTETNGPAHDAPKHEPPAPSPVPTAAPPMPPPREATMGVADACIAVLKAANEPLYYKAIADRAVSEGYFEPLQDQSLLYRSFYDVLSKNTERFDTGPSVASFKLRTTLLPPPIKPAPSPGEVRRLIRPAPDAGPKAWCIYILSQYPGQELNYRQVFKLAEEQGYRRPPSITTVRASKAFHAAMSKKEGGVFVHGSGKGTFQLRP